MKKLRRNQGVTGMTCRVNVADNEYHHYTIRIGLYRVLDACEEWKWQVKNGCQLADELREKMDQIVSLNNGSSIYLTDSSYSEFELVWQDDSARRSNWYGLKLEAADVCQSKLRMINRAFKGVDGSAIGGRAMTEHLLAMGVVPVKYVRYGVYFQDSEFDVDELTPDMTTEHVPA